MSGDAAGEFDEGLDAAASGPGEPVVEGLDGLVVGELKNQSEAFLEEVRAVEAAVGLGNPGERMERASSPCSRKVRASFNNGMVRGGRTD